MAIVLIAVIWLAEASRMGTAETTLSAPPGSTSSPGRPFPGPYSATPLCQPDQNVAAAPFGGVDPKSLRGASLAEIQDAEPPIPGGDRAQAQWGSLVERGSRYGAYPTFNWSGFLQVDSGWFIQDDVSEQTLGHIGDRTGLRRARLRAYGNTRRTTAYVVDLDFAASGHPSFRDVALTFHEIPWFQNLIFGYFQQPFSMDAETSGQQLLFMERRLPFAFAPFRQTGLAANTTYLNRRLHWAVAAYRFPTDQFGRSIGSSGGYALASRLTVLPWYRDNGRRLVHMGFGYSYGDPGDNLVRYQTQAGFFVADTGGSAEEEGSDTGVPVFVDTGEIPTDTYSLLNAELAGNLGSLHLQSEVTFSVVDQRGGPTTTFSGAYAQMGYYLTGESRAYDLERGVFGHARPHRDFERGRGGAWEVAAGWSYIDLDDKNVHGGSMHEYSLALNWYLNPLTKLVANYAHAFLRDPELGPSQAKVIALRAQFRF